MNKYVKNIFIFIFTLFSTLIFFELLFRYSEISLPSIVLNDSKLGRDFNPNSNVMILNEGFFLGEINEGGYLGDYYPKNKSNDVFRIALCGDSFVEGFQLFYKHHFASILKKELQEKSSDNIEVLNFGKSGQDFRTIYINYLEKVKEYNPDITLFFVNNSDFTSKDGNLGPSLKFTDDSLLVDTTFNLSEEYLFKEKYSFLREFAFYSLFQSAFRLFRQGKTSDILFDKLSPSKLFAKKEHSEQKNKLKFDTELNLINIAILKAIRENNNFSNKKIIIVSINKMMEYYNKLIFKYEIEKIDLLDPLKSIKHGGIDPCYWKATNKFGHWTPATHKVIGNYLAKKIQEKQFVNK